MDSILQTLDMGRYAQYVWPCFGMTFLLMIIEPLLLRYRQKSIIQRLKRIQRMQDDA